MARFHLDERYNLPTLADLRVQWANIPDGTVRAHVAVEEHYLRFHLWLLNSLRVDGVDDDGAIEDVELRGPTRAGALRAGILLFASICEAVLLAHADARALRHRDAAAERRRARWTFGTIVEVWQQNHAPEFRAIERDVETLRDARNRVHIQRAIEDRAYWPQAIADEVTVQVAGESTLRALRAFRSPL